MWSIFGGISIGVGAYVEGVSASSIMELAQIRCLRFTTTFSIHLLAHCLGQCHVFASHPIWIPQFLGVHGTAFSAELSPVRMQVQIQLTQRSAACPEQSPVWWRVGDYVIMCCSLLEDLPAFGRDPRQWRLRRRRRRRLQT